MPDDAAVITIEGVCDNAQAGSQCRTQVSRADFEKLVALVRPSADMQTRKMIAQQYAQMLVIAKQGEKMGVDQDPRFKERLKILRIQAEAQMADEKIKEAASNITDADVKAYYDANAPSFEELTVTRIFVPKSDAGAENPGAASKTPAPAADARQVAEKARQQLLKKEDPAKVQAGALEALNNKNAAPSTQAEHVRRGRGLPPNVESQVFGLKVGDVSEVISDPSGYAVYRVDKKEQLPMDAARDEIKRTLQRQRMQDQMATLMNSSKTEFNEAYFGSSQPGPGAMAPQAQPPAKAPTLNSRPYPKSNTPGQTGSSSSPKK